MNLNGTAAADVQLLIGLAAAIAFSIVIPIFSPPSAAVGSARGQPPVGDGFIA